MASPQKENGYTAIANEILDKLAKTYIPGEARQMLDLIIRKTYGFQKKSDEISTTQFIQNTGLPRWAVNRHGKTLAEMNLITVCVIAHTSVRTYSFQKDYTKWKVYAELHTVRNSVRRYTQLRTQTIRSEEHTSELQSP